MSTPKIVVVKNEIGDLSECLPDNRQVGETYLLAKLNANGNVGDCALVQVMQIKAPGNVVLLGGQKDAVLMNPVVNAFGALAVEQDLRLARLEVKLGLRVDPEVARAADPLSDCRPNGQAGKERPS
jgi:hypothetical protein